MNIGTGSDYGDSEGRETNGSMLFLIAAHSLFAICGQEIMTFAICFLGAHVYMACRNMEKDEEARKEIISAQRDAHVTLIHLNLSSMASVRHCAAKFLAGNTFSYPSWL